MREVRTAFRRMIDLTVYASIIGGMANQLPLWPAVMLAPAMICVLLDFAMTYVEWKAAIKELETVERLMEMYK